MEKLETQLDDMLVKKAPVQLPENGRRGLVSVLPWLTLIGGVLMLWSAWSLWQLVAWVDSWANLANSFGAAYGYATPVTVSPLIWVSLVILLVEAVLFFVAFPALRDHKKKGWDILFWVSIVNVAESIVQAIAYTNFGSLVMSLLGSLIGLYLLFQVRAYYTGEKKMPVVVTPAAGTTMNVPKETPATPVTPVESKPVDAGTPDKKA